MAGETDREMPSFDPAPVLRNRHVQSVLASLKFRLWLQRDRGRRLEAQATRHELDCGDGVRLTGYHSPQPDGAQRGLVILIHGWEGCHRSVYLHSMASHLYAHGFGIFRLNLRDHGGTHHLNRGVFHSGLMRETLAAVRTATTRFGDGDSPYMIGFSLGGNFALRLALQGPGQGFSPRHTIAISPLINPRPSLRYLDNGALIYRLYFLHKWRASLSAKAKAFPGEFDFSAAQRMTRFSDMNRHLADNFTPYRNYADYLDTYTLTGDAFRDLRVPATLITAEDDPIVPVADFRHVQSNPNLTVTITRHGGHCGFVENWRLNNWAEQRVLELLTGNR